MKKEIEQIILRSSSIIKESISLSSDIEKAVTVIVNCLKKGNKVILFGNGGSAADAQHIAAEFIGRFQKERKSFPAISLTSDSSILTSLSNDYSFDLIFSRQCESLVNTDDVVIAISTSGNSKNIVKGLEISKEKGAKIITLLGNSGGIIKNYSDITIIVDSKVTARIQEVHRVIYHIICYMVEKRISE
jgi:D-sedoheptulose 7-phosphate isomerase